MTKGSGRFREASPGVWAGLLSALLWAAASAPPALAQAVHGGDESYWGRPVIRVRLDSDASLDLRNFPDQVVQNAGEPLDPAKVRQTLKNLFSTGRFRDLRADVTALDAGVELVLVARAALFVGIVRVEGVRKPVDPAVLVTASGLRLGQKFDDEDLERARERLTAVLKENAYHDARVEHRVTPDPATQVAEILFLVVPGESAKLGSIEFHGDLAVPIQKLTSTSGWKVRAHLTSVRLERGLFKIHQLFLKLGHPQALITILAREFNPQNNTETLAIQIEPGPLVRVSLEGAKLSQSKLRAILPFDREGSLDETGVALGAASLREYFERQGYFQAKVDGRISLSADSRTAEIVYQVQLGQAGVFAGFEFQGNHHVPAEELSEVVSLDPKDFLRERGLFSEGLLASDAFRLKTLYARNGYPNAEIRPEVIEDHEGRSGRIFVRFNINEGARMTVGRLELEGVSRAAVNEMWPSLVSKPGRAYSPTAAQADRETILRHYADRGYPSASVDFEFTPASNPQEMDLTFHVITGAEERIQRVVVLGRQRTRAGTISRELTLQPGSPLRQSDVLETQRQLYDLGVLSQVQIAPQEPESGETNRTVLVGLEEARRWTVGYGGGIEFQRLGSEDPQGDFKVSPRLTLEVSRLNVGGRAQTVSLRGRFSNIEKGGAISYLIPRFPTRRDLSLSITGLAQRSREVVTFTALRREVLLSLEKRLTPAEFLAVRFSFRKVEALDFPPGAEQQIPIASRNARIAMFGLGYGNDRRDEPTDATRGTYNIADAGFSGRKYGSQSNFFRAAFQNATYHRISPHLVFARTTRVAVESTVGGGGAAGGIPLPERFFMGGSESHRGFSINQAGPRDPVTGFPLGGEALFFNSLELRVRLANERLGVVFFQDAGNVFSKIQRMRLLKFTQSSRLDLDFNSLAAGIGVRYKTPVGPFRFDVGYNFNPPRYQVIPDGTPNGIPAPRRLPHFQFFVGIGQSF